MADIPRHIISPSTGAISNRYITNHTRVFIYPVAIYYTLLPIFDLIYGSRANPFDELTIIIVVSIAVFYTRSIVVSTTTLIAGVGFTVFIVFSLLSSLASEIEDFPIWPAYARGQLLDLKPFVVFLSAALILRRGRADAGMHVLMIALIACGLINVPFALRDAFLTDMSVRGIPLQPAGLWSIPVGLFSIKVDSAQTCLLAYIASELLFCDKCVRKERATKYFILSLVFLFVLLLHIAVKELVVAVFLFVSFRIRHGKFSSFIYLASAMFLAGAIALSPFADPIYSRVKSKLDIFVFNQGISQTVRNRSYTASLEIAFDHFPFGTGPGTFLSAPSRTLGYSPVYEEYGISEIHGGSLSYDKHLLDVFWPKILGESGLIGLIGYLVFFLVPFWVSAKAFFAGSVTSLASVFPFPILLSSLVISLADSNIAGPIFGIITGISLALACFGRRG